MRASKRISALVGIVTLLAVIAAAPPSFAGGRLIAGADLGLASPIDNFRDRANNGGVIAPFVGYMLNDFLGVLGQAQVAGFPVANASGTQDNDTWPLAGLVGPRLSIPLSFGESPSELYLTWTGGAFTGLTAGTPVSRTSWGYSTGGGFNLGVTPRFMIGPFVRYNWLDQRVNEGGQERVRYFTAGVGITYNIAMP